jgi:hypothetical protein
MDKIVQHIIDSSKKESDLPQLKKDLENVMDKILEKFVGHLNSALKYLDPSKHSLGVLYLL